MSKQADLKLPGFIAYVVRENNGASFWDRIGAAWPHKDKEGFTLQLHALPADGRIVIRARKDGEASERGAQ
jgi:hypothetical protein